MSRVLIIGIGGFSGSYMQEYLRNKMLHKSYDFFGIGVKETCESRFIKYQKVDATKEKDLEEYLFRYKPNYIINFCGEYANTCFESMKELNFLVTKNIINTVLKKELMLNKLLIIGSAAEYGIVDNLPIKESNKLRPKSDYGLTKKMQTELALKVFKSDKFPVVIARTFNLYGSGISENLLLGKYEKLIEDAIEGAEIRLKNAEYIRDYINIKDAVEAYWTLLIDGIPGEIYNVCSGKGKRVREMVEELVKNSGKEISILKDNDCGESDDIRKSIGDPTKINKLMSKF